MSADIHGDSIIIQNLAVLARVGVTEEERAEPQHLTVSVALGLGTGFAAIADRLENTVDYAAVCDALKAEAKACQRNLIETLAEDLAAEVLQRFPISKVTVEVRKVHHPRHGIRRGETLQTGRVACGSGSLITPQR